MFFQRCLLWNELLVWYVQALTSKFGVLIECTILHVEQKATLHKLKSTFRDVNKSEASSSLSNFVFGLLTSLTF